MTCSRVVDLTTGVAMIVTDLHGDFDRYRRYRDQFLKLHAWGFAQTLVFCGDLIHRESPPEEDGSLDIILDLLELKAYLGADLVVLLGNHEMPHIYGSNLARGEIEYTPRFEAAMGQHREAVVTLFKSLPIYVRTQAGVMISHAGVPEVVATPGAWEALCNFDHDALLAQAQAALDAETIAHLREEFAGSAGVSYDELVRHYLAVETVDDPRYNDLLRALLVTNFAAFDLLWAALFTRNEFDIGEARYGQALDVFLHVASQGFSRQQVMVAGHLPAKGRQVVAKRHLRLASGAHAYPPDAASYLLFDTAQPVQDASDLLDQVRRLDDD